MNLFSGTTWTADALALGVGLAWKAAAVSAAVSAAVLALGRRKAAVAAAVGNAGVAGLLLLPLSAVALPTFAVRCLPVVPAAKGVAAVSPAAPPGAGEIPAWLETKPDEPGPERSEARPVRRAAGGPSETRRPEPVEAPARRLDPATALVAGYGGVASLLLLRLAAALSAVARLRRGAVGVDDPAWLAALEGCRVRLGVRPGVTLGWSGGVGVPVVVGWLRPTVLLPASAASLDPAEHAEAIFLHELAHVRRADYPWAVLQRLAGALYWPHPLVWALGRALDWSRERACDELCVHELGGPGAYRATLLAVASGMARRSGPSLGMAMARRSKLGRRLAGIDRSRGSARCLPRRSTRLAVGALGIAAAGLVGATQLTRAVARPAPAPAPQAVGAGKTLRLQIVAADTGKPVPNATVRVWSVLKDDWRTADADGRITIAYATGPIDRSVTVDVWGDGYAMQRHNWGQHPGQSVPAEATIRLQPGETLGGVVRDEQGEPVAGAAVYLWSHNYKRKDPHELLYDLKATTGPNGRWSTSSAPETTGELIGWHVDHPDFLSDREYAAGRPAPAIADLLAGKAVAVLAKGTPIEGRVVDPDGKPVAGATVRSSTSEGDLYGGTIKAYAVTTDADGRFRTGQVGPKEYFLLALAKGHAPGAARAAAGKPVEVRLGRPRPFQGRVVDPDGKPVEGAFVNVDTWQRYRFLGVFLFSDADGRFRWDDAPDDPLSINVIRDGYLHQFQQQVEPTDPDVRFILRPCFSIQGTVRDAETNKRVEQALIEFGTVDAKTGKVETWAKNPETGIGVRVNQGYLDANVPLDAVAEAFQIRIVAEGYEPSVSRTFRREERAVSDYEIKLSPAKARPGSAATAVGLDGKPLAGARVYRGEVNKNVSVRDGKVSTPFESGREVRTDEKGAFPVPTEDTRWVMLVVGDDGFGYANRDAIKALPMVETKPYARVEGRAMIGGRPAANAKVELRGHIQDDSTSYCTIFLSQAATTDADGRFRFEKVIPASGLRVSRENRGDDPDYLWSIGEPVEVEPGETARMTLGGRGRPVVGRLAFPEGGGDFGEYARDHAVKLETNRALTPEPVDLVRAEMGGNAGGQLARWRRDWGRSEKGLAYERAMLRTTVGIGPDGSFRFDDVPEGVYRLRTDVRAGFEREPASRYDRIVVVPPVPGGQSDEPLDLGRLAMWTPAAPKVGKPAPDFAVTTNDGRKLALADFRGRYLLLDVNAPWSMQSRFQVARMDKIFARFGRDERFALLSVTVDADADAARAFVAEKNQPWPQALVGSPGPDNPLTRAYGLNGSSTIDAGCPPRAFLIGPDGTLLAESSWAVEKLEQALAKALDPK